MLLLLIRVSIWLYGLSWHIVIEFNGIRVGLRLLFVLCLVADSVHLLINLEVIKFIISSFFTHSFYKLYLTLANLCKSFFADLLFGDRPLSKWRLLIILHTPNKLRELTQQLLRLALLLLP